MMVDQFQKALEEKGITLASTHLPQYEQYYETLVEWNEKMNLTAITEKGDVYLKHFFDSISAGFYYDFRTKMSVCDVGAGAGFPSIPIKIAFPNLHITIVDSLNKRITFLEHLAKMLKLENVRFVHDRAETFGQNKEYREQFDVVTARAVARLSVLSELCIPLVKKGGVFIAMKAASAEDEVNSAQRAIKALGGEIIQKERFLLPIE